MREKIILLAFVGLALLILVLGIVKLVKMYKHYSRHEMGSALRKTIKFSLGTFAFTLLIGIMFTFMYWYVLRQSASAVISLSYDVASEAKNANHTRYNMNDIISNEVLKMAIEKGALENVSVGQLKDCTSVKQSVQGDSFDEDKYHISTEFIVTFTANKYTNHLDPATVVKLISESYRDYYVSTYTENDILLDMKTDVEAEFGAMEYLDIVERLHDKAALISNYLEGIDADNSGFVNVNGESARSLQTEVLQYDQAKIIENLKSYILENSVAKNRTIYKKRLKYRNTMLDYDLQKAKSSFDTRNDAVRMYEESLMSIVLVPSWDDQGEYYMSRTKLGLDELSLQAKTYSANIATLRDDVETNSMVISKLNKAITAGAADNTEALVAEISEDIDNYAYRAKKLVREYTENRLNHCVSISTITWSFRKLVIVSILVTLIWCIGLHVFLVSNTVDNYVPLDEKL